MRKSEPIASARWRYIVSFIMVSVLPLLICASLILMSNHQNNQAQLENAMLDKLELVKTQLDLMFKKLESTGMQFASSGVWAVHEQDGQDNPISAQLYGYWEDQPFLEDIAYLPVGQPYIFTPRKKMPYLDFFDLKQEYFSLNLSAFFTKMNTLTSATLLPTHRTTRRYVDGGRIIFLLPVPQTEAAREGAIAFFIRDQVVFDMFEECFWDTDGYYYILDQNMSMLYTSTVGQEADMLRDRLNHLPGTGLFHQEVDQRDYVMLRTVSDTSGAYYMAAFPAASFYAQARYFMGNQAAVLVGALALVTVFSVMLALFFYRPLEQFLRSLSSQTKQSFSNHSQGLRHAGLHLERISADHAALSAQVNSHQQVLMRQLINGLLQGQLHERGADLLREQLQLHWSGTGFVALHAWLEQRPQGLLPVERWILPVGVAYAVPGERGDQVAILADIVVEGDHEALREQIAQACKGLLEKSGAGVLRLGVGGFRREPVELGASHLEAQSMGREQSAGDMPVIVLFSPSGTSNVSDSFLPLSEKELLVQCMINGNAQAGLKTLDQLEENLRAFGENRTMMRSVFFYLYDAMVTTANSLQLTLRRTGLDQGIATASLEVFMGALRACLEEACAQVQRRQQHSAAYTQNKILLYVHEHFREHTLSMDELCAHFDLSASYLARFFKQETGYSFLQYTGQLRMNYVKAQLDHTQKPIKDIVREAGYLDVASFIRKFRQQEGMTPGDYRAEASSRENT